MARIGFQLRDGDDYCDDWEKWLADCEKVAAAARHLLIHGDAVGFYPLVEQNLNDAIDNLEAAHLIESCRGDLRNA